MRLSRWEKINKSHILKALRSRLGFPPALVEQELLGRMLQVRDGAVRYSPDKDDAWLLALACHAKCIVDVGCNMGQAALLMQRSASVKEILLVDPNPDAISLAAENLIRNNLSQYARFVTAFVSDQDDEEVTFWTVGTGAAGSRYAGHANTAARKNSSTQVLTLTLDTICAQYSLVPDLVKVDVEGAEYGVLIGSCQLASRGQTRFFVEMHSPPELSMEENAQRVLEWCEKLDYTAWYLKDKSKLTAAEQIQHRGRCHLLLQPCIWTLPEWLKQIEESAPLDSATDEMIVLR